MAKSGKKVFCRKCNKSYYQVGFGKKECPNCAKAALVPNGTISILQLTIQPGGYSDVDLCVENGFGHIGPTGAITLKGMARVLSGSYKGTKFMVPIGISSQKNDYWQNKGRELIRGILNSSQGLSPSDNSRKAVFGRIIDSYEVLDGIAFVGIIGIEKSRLGKDQNTILRALSGDDQEYKVLVGRGAFVPAQKTLKPSTAGTPVWLKV